MDPKCVESEGIEGEQRCARGERERPVLCLVKSRAWEDERQCRTGGPTAALAEERRGPGKLRVVSDSARLYGTYTSDVGNRFRNAKWKLGLSGASAVPASTSSEDLGDAERLRSIGAR